MKRTILILVLAIFLVAGALTAIKLLRPEEKAPEKESVDTVETFPESDNESTGPSSESLTVEDIVPGTNFGVLEPF